MVPIRNCALRNTRLLTGKLRIYVHYMLGVTIVTHRPFLYSPEYLDPVYSSILLICSHGNERSRSCTDSIYFMLWSFPLEFDRLLFLRSKSNSLTSAWMSPLISRQVTTVLFLVYLSSVKGGFKSHNCCILPPLTWITDETERLFNPLVC